MSTKNAAKAKKRPKRSRILAVAILTFVVYTVVTLVQLQMELDDRQKVLDDVSQQITQQQRTNEDLQDKLNNYEKYLEEQVRQRGMARPGEIVFQEIPGIE